MRSGWGAHRCGKKMKRFLPGRWKGEGGGVDRKRLLGHANALWTARCRQKQQTLFVAALEERARIQFQEGRKRLEGFRQTVAYAPRGAWLRCGRNIGDSRLQEWEEEFRIARNDDEKPSTRNDFSGLRIWLGTLERGRDSISSAAAVLMI